MEMAVHMTIAAAVFGADLFYVVFSHMVPWVGSRIQLFRFLRIILHTFGGIETHARVL